MTTNSTVRPEQEPVPSSPADEEPPPPAASPGAGERPAVDAAHRTESPVPADDRPERGRGFPAGQVAAGGLSVAAAVLAGLYHLAGVWGLAAAGVAAGGGTVAYLRHRRGPHHRPSQGRGVRPSGSPRTSGAGRGTGRTGGASSGGLRWGGAGGPGRRGRAAGFGGASVGSGRRTSGAGRARTGRTGGASSDRASAGAGRSGGLLGRLTRTGRTGRGIGTGGTSGFFGRRRSRTGRAGVGTSGQSGRADRRTGQGTGRSTGQVRGSGVGRRVRKVAAWTDRRTGRRAGTAWAAARKSRTFRGARRAALAARSGARRWDAEMTAGLVALVAWLTARWRHHRAPTPDSTDGTQSTDTAENTGETGSTDADAGSDAPAGEGKETTAASSTASPPAPEPDPVPAAVSGTGFRPYRRRNRPMTAFPLAGVAAEMNAAAAGYAPADMWVVARELDQLPEVPANIAMAIRTYTTRLQAEYPIDSAVVEAIHRLYQAQAMLVGLAEEIGPLFRRIHAEDLRREEAPRTNEPLWNV